MNKDFPVIKCPVCGTCYIPSEIYMPDSFFGKQTEITRRPSGEIDFYLGSDPDMNEEFICEGCLSKLHIHANLTFNIDVVKEENFDEDYSTSISKPKKLKLEETELF